VEAKRLRSDGDHRLKPVVVHRQLKEDKSMCPACYFAHRTLARSILRTTKPGQLTRQVNKDLLAFEAYQKKKQEMYDKVLGAKRRPAVKGNTMSGSEKRSIKRGIENIRAGRVMTKKELLKKHPELK
jgi:hypothetical protein